MTITGLINGASSVDKPSYCHGKLKIEIIWCGGRNLWQLCPASLGGSTTLPNFDFRVLPTSEGVVGVPVRVEPELNDTRDSNSLSSVCVVSAVIVPFLPHLFLCM